MKKKPLLIISQIVVAIVVIVAVVYFSKNTIGRTNNVNSTVDEHKQNPTTQVTEIYKIGVLQCKEDDSLTQAYNGFLERMSECGYKEGENLIVDYNMCGGDEAKCKENAQSYIDAQYDLIYAIGEEAAKCAYDTTKDIPIVFTAVGDAEELGIIESNESPNTNVTGVSDFIPCFEQMILVDELYPDAKKVGALYAKEDADSLLQVSIAKKQAESEELGLEFSSYPVSEEKDIEQIVQVMCEEVEVIYLPVDTMIYNDIQTVLNTANEKKVPVIGANLSAVEAGCVGTYIVSYPAIGKESADIVIDILVNDKKPADIPVGYKHDCDLYLNKNAVSLLELEVDKALLDKANII